MGCSDDVVVALWEWFVKNGPSLVGCARVFKICFSYFHCSVLLDCE